MILDEKQAERAVLECIYQWRSSANSPEDTARAVVRALGLARQPAYAADLLMAPGTVEDTTSRQNMVSDVLHAEQAILWDRRPAGTLRTQLQSFGLTMEQLEETLLALAADVHKRRTGTRVGAILVEDGQAQQAWWALNDYEARYLGDNIFGQLKDGLTRLFKERQLR